MADEVTIQRLVHSLEQGNLASWIRGALLLLLVVVLFFLYLFVQFRGLDSEEAMDQAQIARQISEGEGFTTGYIRPLAIWQLEQAGKEIPEGAFPEFSNMPVYPFVASIALGFVGDLDIEPSDIVYAGDRMLAGLGIVCFLLATGIFYFVGRLLFDARVALIATGAVLLTDLFWQWSLTGLPQMLLLLEFAVASLFMVRATMARLDEQTVMMCVWLALSAAMLGLMTLTHGLAIWLAIGFLGFTIIYFTPRALSAIVVLLAFAVVVTPWLLRNYAVSGTPFGLFIYEAWAGKAAYVELLRTMLPDIAGSRTGILHKIRTGVVEQAGMVFLFLGTNLLAGLFFVSLMHPFRRPETAAFRWLFLMMWVPAVVGMALYSVTRPMDANDLHVLFIPVFAFYGTAFALVLWNRTEIGLPLLRTAFVSLLLFLCAIPMLLTLFAGSQGRIQWPPYIPPYIGVLGNWTTEDEMLMSDMPWATAWYAQRESLSLPRTIREFNQINDYRVLHKPIVMMYLTPVTGNRAFLSGIVKGPYAPWAAFILRRTENLGNFPLRQVLPLPIDGETIVYADMPRWQNPPQPIEEESEE